MKNIPLKKKNYFELFNIPIKSIKNPLLENKYYELLKKYKNKEEKEKILLNTAYKTLSSDLNRQIYIKELKNESIKLIKPIKLEEIYNFLENNSLNSNLEDLLKEKILKCKEEFFKNKTDEILTEWIYWEKLLKRQEN